MLSQLDQPSNASLSGRSIFVVEDEALVALNLEAMLEELGCVIAGLAMRFEQAETLIRNGIKADAAVLDVNIGGYLVFPLAEALRALDIPVVFATGYGRSGIPDTWRDAQVLQKPYSLGELGKALSTVLHAR